MNRLCKCGCQEEVTNKNNIYIVGHNRRGIKFTEEEIIKHKIRTSGINNGMYGKLGKNNPNFGSKHSEETKKKFREVRKGKDNPFYDKKHSEETKNKISRMNKGKHYSRRTEFKSGKDHPMFGIKGKNHPNYGKKHSYDTKKKMSLSCRREKNHQWLGGKSFEPYDENFNRAFKRTIRERDKSICMLCNIHRDKLKRDLDVHHINYDKLNTTKENCLSLCINCNSKVNHNRVYWTKFFQTLLKEKYRYKY